VISAVLLAPLKALHVSIDKAEMVSKKMSQQENDRKQAEFFKNVAEFL
jgi:hypothetical protein